MISDRFDIGTNVVCIKEYEKLKLRGHYHVNGRGSLDYNFDPNVNGRKGLGFSVKYEEYTHSARKTNTIFYYFTEKEMSEYFITENEDYKQYQRDLKIKQILN